MTEASSRLHCRAFALPKKGNSGKEYEDAAAFDCEQARFAIADGASESAFASEWATLLCQSYVADSFNPARMEDWRSGLRERWLVTITRDSLPWYLQEKIREGAFATFLGLSFAAAKENAPLTWQSFAVGDSCLFHVRHDALQLAFPVVHTDQFGTHPCLIGSCQRSNVVLSTAGGTLEGGDVMFLMTDALAQWFLGEHEAGRNPWTRFAGFQDEDFAACIDSLRQSRAIKNDDVTLLIVNVDLAMQ